jgi:broad specificity phosphatase PhoE
MSKTIEIRRHSIRRPPAPHLIQEGVMLARRLGETTGPFELVVSSTAPRAIETAVAMGFAVNREEDLISQFPTPIDAVLPFPQPFIAYYEARKHPAVAEHLRRLRRFHEELARSLREGGAALVICHGGIVELSAVACLPQADYGAFGPHVECCEGVRLSCDQGIFVHMEVVRLPARLLVK